MMINLGARSYGNSNSNSMVIVINFLFSRNFLCSMIFSFSIFTVLYIVHTVTLYYHLYFGVHYDDMYKFSMFYMSCIIPG